MDANGFTTIAFEPGARHAPTYEWGRGLLVWETDPSALWRDPSITEDMVDALFNNEPEEA